MFKLIFSDPKASRMFLLWALTAGFLQFGYYGVNNWMPSYLEGELGMNFKSMPELDWAYGYPVALVTISATCLVLYRRFKRAGWL